jgi:GNAT superfamily N-acetyltransferase
MVAAWDAQAMAGYAFGSIMGQPQEIWAMIRAAQPDIAASTAQEPIYFFREFAVDPGYQGKGYGRLLHDALLQRRPERLAHLLVRPDNPAKSAYTRWGWRAVGQVQPFPEAPVLDAMVHVLPLD